MNPEPKRKPQVCVNENQDEYPGKHHPKHASPRLRDEEPPHVEPANEQRDSGQEQAKHKEPQRYAVLQGHRQRHGDAVYLEKRSINKADASKHSVATISWGAHQEPGWSIQAASD